MEVCISPTESLWPATVMRDRLGLSLMDATSRTSAYSRHIAPCVYRNIQCRLESFAVNCLTVISASPFGLIHTQRTTIRPRQEKAKTHDKQGAKRD